MPLSSSNEQSVPAIPQASSVTIRARPARSIGTESLQEHGSTSTWKRRDSTGVLIGSEPETVSSISTFSD